jgi:phytoene dehydrogenase-like protein
MKYFSPAEPREPKADERELEALLDLVQPGWRSEVVERQFLPRMLASHAIVQAQQGGMRGRPGPVVPGIRNLYVAGDWAGPEGQLSEASLASARLASHLILTTEASQQEYSYSAASQA